MFDPIPMPTHRQAVEFLQTGADEDVEAHGRTVDYYLWCYGEMEAELYQQIDELKLEIERIAAPIIDAGKSRVNPATGKPFGDKHIDAELNLNEPYLRKKQRVIILEGKRRKVTAYLKALS